MALILNSTVEPQHVRVFGNDFTLAPGKMKNFQDNFAHFIATERRHQGLVRLPESFEDPEYMASPEGKEELARLTKEGREARCNHLRQLIYNNQVSMKQDLDKMNIKADPAAFASDGEIAAMEELVKYQAAMDDEGQKRADRVKELASKIAKQGK